MIYQIKVLDISYSLYPIVLDKDHEPVIIHSSFLKGYERYQISGDMNKELSLNDYLNTIRPNVEELSNKKKALEKRVQVTLSLIFLNYFTDETVEKWVYSDNIDLRATDDQKERTTKLFNPLLHRYQETLEQKMEGISFVFDYVNYLDIKFQQVDLIRGRSYIESPTWLASKKATINPQNTAEDDNKCFVYAVTVALHNHEINNHPERISKLIPYIKNDNINWDRINFLAERKYWERFEKDNKNIALNICLKHMFLFHMVKKQLICNTD